MGQISVEKSAPPGSLLSGNQHATYSDASGAMAARGVKAVEFVSSQSPFKKSDLTTDEGRNRIQARIDVMAQVFVETVATNRGVTVGHVLSAFGKGDVLIGQAAVAAGMADAIGTFESTLAKLAAGNPPARRSSVSKSPAPVPPRSVTRVTVPKVLAPVPTRPAAPVVFPAVTLALASDRARVLAIRDITPPGAEAERDRAIASGESVETFRETLAVKKIERMMRWARGG